MHTKSTGKQVNVHIDAFIEASLLLTEAVLSGRMRINSLVGPGLLESLLPLSDLCVQALLGHQHLPDNHRDAICYGYNTFSFHYRLFRHVCIARLISCWHDFMYFAPIRKSIFTTLVAPFQSGSYLGSEITVCPLSPLSWPWMSVCLKETHSSLSRLIHM